MPLISWHISLAMKPVDACEYYVHENESVGMCQSWEKVPKSSPLREAKIRYLTNKIVIARKESKNIFYNIFAPVYKVLMH